MAESSFPHLALVLKDRFEPKFSPAYSPSDEVEKNKENRVSHAEKLSRALEQFSDWRKEEIQRRVDARLPSIPAGAGFLLRLPEGADGDGISHFLGTQLVAETDEGYILVAASDLSFEKIREALQLFRTNQEGGGGVASVLDIYTNSSQLERVKQILTPEVFGLYPFETDRVYIFDVSFQMAESARAFAFPSCRKRNAETEEEFAKRKRELRDRVIQDAQSKWIEQADFTFDKLREFVGHYGGEFLSGQIHDGEIVKQDLILFPDSFQVRLKLSGAGFMDVVSNFPNVFEVSLPEDIESVYKLKSQSAKEDEINILTPETTASTVCVIDGGIQENHRWLAPAIDKKNSKCFLPGKKDSDISDEQSPVGHGTGVAGLVLYPDGPPKSGTIRPIAWIQNARVCDESGVVPQNLPPAVYLEKVVKHFSETDRSTTIYNHSISGSVACPIHRMTAWAAKMDDLSHRVDVLFIQCVGNLSLGFGLENSPGVYNHLSAGRDYPSYLLAPASRIANPAQSLHALTVGSVSGETFDSPPQRSFVSEVGGPSCFSRTGYGLWDTIKPEVVEIGGDAVRNIDHLAHLIVNETLSLETLNATHDGAPAYSKDKIGTSYSTARVSNIAARLQNIFPDSSPLLFRSLIVQSARWPDWAEQHGQTDDVLRHIGYGVPSLERASSNSSHRVTLITPEACEIPAKELHLYIVPIPEEIRNKADSIIRMEVTLSYTATPRRTRSSRRGYLETWLDWRSSGLDEPIDNFVARMKKEDNGRKYSQPQWKIHFDRQHGDAEETRRDAGTVQKDWADIDAEKLPEQLGIAVRAHNGWNHREAEGIARYCLVVSFEARDHTLPVYALIASQIEVPVEQQVEVK